MVSLSITCRPSGSAAEAVEDAVPQQLLGRGLLGAVDVDLGLEDRHEAGVEDLLGRTSNCWSSDGGDAGRRRPG